MTTANTPKQRIVQTIAAGLAKLPLLDACSPRDPTILMYHGIPTRAACGSVGAAALEQHIRYLKRHFDLICPAEVSTKRARFGRQKVLLTFDDGFRNNAEVVAPILAQHQVPALFFVGARHSRPGKYLWFSYLAALKAEYRGVGLTFRGSFVDMRREQREASVAALERQLHMMKPYPEAMYTAIEELPRLEEFCSEERIRDSYAGMTEHQIEEMAANPLFTFGVHTEDHPYLTLCDTAEMQRQIAQNQQWLQRVSCKKVDSIAYPAGDYDSSVLATCRDLGLTTGYAVIPRLRTSPNLERSRIGIYAPALGTLGFKVKFGNLLRKLNVSFG